MSGDPRERVRAAPVSLSARLHHVLELVRPCAVLADVGTDHALLPIAAVQRGLAGRAIAADLREAPLRGARANIARADELCRVLALQGDGLSPLRERAVDAVVIAGMSAESMLRMFDREPGVLARVLQLILQPNQNVDRLRAWALRSGWHLSDERMLEERGRFFVMCAFARAPGADPAYRVPGWADAALCSVGPWLLARRDPVARRCFEQQRARLSRCVQQGGSQLRPELEVSEAACRALAPGSASSGQ